ncbi:MAG: ATP-dependent RNA helicase HrpA [Burkholderiales bacterium]|nr:ATP-dependent RNA helicase HrpA [Burkholderiales bacterium]
MPVRKSRVPQTAVRSRFTPAEIEARRLSLPRPEFPPELPVSAKRAEIARAIEEHPVVIVCGETGSGKTTQLPKICLELGRGVAGMIGHTQPRRIAARSTAVRIAQELKSELGRAVGYKIRFTDKVSPASYVKLMTDGILLAETQGDRALGLYDTLIIDEAHERSLNIDFLLGYLRDLVLAPNALRPDLKLVVTSATIDAERFARHFATGGVAAPVIEVSGRLYPVEVRYRPVSEDRDDEEDLYDAIAAAVDDVSRLGPGDVLVFLPGEREIREATEALRKHQPPGGSRAREILPLYARLSAAEQERIFKPHGGRRIVLATNVAETSLTVPGIRYVVDSGLARVKRYSYRNKVEQLRVEKISRAAAAQRAGRCGRVSSGVCVRLYEEEDFGRRAAYTDPEVLRSSLAAVILRMKSLGLAEVETFPFIDPPAPRAVADGYALLAELGAVDEDKRLTEVGRQLARLPVDPRIGRMVLAAKSEGSLAEVLVIAAALSVQDPRERPLERAAAADAAQQRFDDERSDFLAYLKLWRFFEEALEHKKSNAKLRELCHGHFLSWLRLREWREVHAQLKELISEMGWHVGALSPEPAKSYAPIHRALLAGLLGNVGLKSEEGNYLGARGIRFWVHPGSGVGKKAGRWVMAAEITETTRLYARCVATVEPAWIEALAGPLLKRAHADPHWEKNAGAVIASERGTLYGLPVYGNRRVQFGPIDPPRSREIMIREALLAGDYDSRAPFFLHNTRLKREIEELEHKSRRPDVLVDEELIFAFYDARIPASVFNAAGFEAWRREAESREPKRLFLAREDLMRHEAAGITTEQVPPALDMAGRSLVLEYRHDPGGTRDGVTLTVPIAALNQVDVALADWLVPGLAREKAIQLAKTLPQKIRHRLGPLPEFANTLVQAERPRREPGAAAPVAMAEAIARYARRELNLAIPPDAIRPEAIPAHLRMNFRVVDEHGRQLAMGRNLLLLRQELGERARAEFAEVLSEAAGEAAGRSGLSDWSFGELEEVMEVSSGARSIVGYPGLVDQGASVSLEVFDSADKAAAVHRAGLRRLFMLALKEQVRSIEKGVPQALALQYAALGDVAELRAQLVAAAFERAFMAEPLPRTRTGFERRREEGKPRVTLIAQELSRLAAAIFTESAALAKKLAPMAKAFPEAAREIHAWSARLLHRRFIEHTPRERLQHFPRYLRAAGLRLDKLRADPARDARAAAQFAQLALPWEREFARQARTGAPVDPRIEQFRWLLEELRVQLFAQELKTPVPVSVKRLSKMWEGMRG